MLCSELYLNIKIHMKFKTLFFSICIATSAVTTAQNIPGRAVILSGDTTNDNHRQNISVMYSRANLAFEDPAAPRFLFLDKKGTVALGIGGYLKATGMYDMRGAVDNNGFYTNKIPVPVDPAFRERFGATANHSSIFLKLVSSPTKLGRVIVYIQSNFTGDGGNYGFKLKQAYMSVGHMTFGKARSVFSDASAMAPTVDDQGPAGQVSAKNMLIKYESASYGGFSGAISVELPDASYTEGVHTEAIAQRFPDIPVYVQYAWDGGDSHIRASGILRQLSYRDMLNAENHFRTGWGAQISAVSKVAGGLGVFGHYTYGRGIASYINDLADLGYDLVPEGNGKLMAPRMAGWTAGMQYTFSSDFFVSASYSQARLYDNVELGAGCYDIGQYIAANAFYNPIPDLRLGVEYLHGIKKELNGLRGHANRVEAMIQFNF